MSDLLPQTQAHKDTFSQTLRALQILEREHPGASSDPEKLRQLLMDNVASAYRLEGREVNQQLIAQVVEQVLQEDGVLPPAPVPPPKARDSGWTWLVMAIVSVPVIFILARVVIVLIEIMIRII